ncbi:uncharacterized protein LOC110696071 [Chenopodium quinoa]|uniref:uncharacterized protein LOC110696071 n=1 Tax=Chenopodium quinoa TaxID=63459 RepID=UPI000B78AD6A|nr:uncharacterized protein LOC110696071 [Chenopodium quinoa]
MNRVKIAALSYILSSVMILMGFIAQFTSYSKYGAVWCMFGFGVISLMSFWYVQMLTVKAPFYKELFVFELVCSVSQVFGLILASLGDFSIYIFEGPAWFVWVGIAGCLLMLVGGVALLVKEIVIEKLEGESLLPVNQGGLKK